MCDGYHVMAMAAGDHPGTKETDVHFTTCLKDTKLQIYIHRLKFY